MDYVPVLLGGLKGNQNAPIDYITDGFDEYINFVFSNDVTKNVLHPFYVERTLESVIKEISEKKVAYLIVENQSTPDKDFVNRLIMWFRSLTQK